MPNTCNKLLANLDIKERIIMLDLKFYSKVTLRIQKPILQNLRIFCVKQRVKTCLLEKFEFIEKSFYCKN